MQRADDNAHTDTIRIFLHDVTLDLSVGIYDAERRHTQKVTVHIDIDAEATKRFDDLNEQDLTQVINYDAIYNFLHEDLPRLGHIGLLETLAEQIMIFCLRDPRVKCAHIRLEKNEVYPGAAVAGIELTRYRKTV